MAYICSCDIGGVSFALAIYVAVLGGLALVIWVIAILISGTTEEDIEKELRDCRKVSGAKKD
jgi:hypothetical protein